MMDDFVAVCRTTAQRHLMAATAVLHTMNKIDKENIAVAQRVHQALDNAARSYSKLNAIEEPITFVNMLSAASTQTLHSKILTQVLEVAARTTQRVAADPGHELTHVLRHEDVEERLPAPTAGIMRQPSELVKPQSPSYRKSSGITLDEMDQVGTIEDQMDERERLAAEARSTLGWYENHAASQAARWEALTRLKPILAASEAAAVSAGRSFPLHEIVAR